MYYICEIWNTKEEMQLLEVASDLCQAPATFENPGVGDVIIYQSFSFIYFDSKDALYSKYH